MASFLPLSLTLFRLLATYLHASAALVTLALRQLLTPLLHIITDTSSCSIPHQAVMMQVELSLDDFERRPRQHRSEADLIDMLERTCSPTFPGWQRYGVTHVQGIPLVSTDVQGCSSREAASGARACAETECSDWVLVSRVNRHANLFSVTVYGTRSRRLRRHCITSRAVGHGELLHCIQAIPYALG